MKSRLWEGIVPMSQNTWRKKGLDDAENFDLAIQYLWTVVDAFSYLNMVPVQPALKDVFNNYHKAWRD